MPRSQSFLSKEDFFKTLEKLSKTIPLELPPRSALKDASDLDSEQMGLNVSPRDSSTSLTFSLLRFVLTYFFLHAKRSTFHLA